VIAVFDTARATCGRSKILSASLARSIPWSGIPQGLRQASKIILPGVGHFGQMMRALDALAVRETFLERIRRRRAIPGHLPGLQALFEASEEAPDRARGLGLYEGCGAAVPAGRARSAHGLE